MTLLRLLPVAGLALLLTAGSPSASSASEGRLAVVSSDTAGLTLDWTVQPGAPRLRASIAVPPGSMAGAFVTTPDGRPGPANAARIVASGWAAGAPYVDVELDGAGLRPGLWTVEVRFVPGSPGSDAPAGPEAIARLLAEPVVRDFERAGPGFLNPDLAEQARAITEADRSLRPALPLSLRRGLEGGNALVRRSRPGLRSRDLPSDGPSLPPGDARIESFSAGRIRILVGPATTPGGPGGEGIYRITHAQLVAVGADLTDVVLDDLRLMNRGTRADPIEIAIRTFDANSDGLFGSSDWFEFFGQPMVGENAPRVWHGGDYTDLNVYVLDSAPGPRERMRVRDGSPVSPPSGDYLETLHLETNDLFFSTRTGEYNVDHYFWCSAQSLLTRNGDPPRSRVETATLEGLVPGSARRGAVRARLFSRLPDVPASPDHRSQLEVAGRVVSDLSGEGYEIVDHEATNLSPATDLAPSTPITLTNPGVIGVASRFEVDFIEVDYPRAPAARAGQLVFPHAGGSSITVSGLVSGDVTVLDVTDPIHPVLLTSLAPAGGAVTFELGTAGPSRWAVSSVPDHAPTGIGWIVDHGLRDASNRGEILVVGPQAWLEPPVAGLQRWMDDRTAQGFSIRLAPTEHVIDDMRQGMFSPAALYDLLVLARATWAERPQFVVLVGDTTIDFKNQLGGVNLNPTTCTPFADDCGFDEVEWVQHVPAIVYDVPGDQLFLGYFASDAIYTLIEGTTGPPSNDWRPDLAIGRLPARSAQEASDLFDKVLGYEGQRGSGEPWHERVHFVADAVGTAQENAFQDVQDSANARLVAPCYPSRTFYLTRDYGGPTNNPDPTVLEPLTVDLLAAWEDPAEGAALLSYVGHGAAYRWSGADLMLNRGDLASGCRNDAETLDQPGVTMPFILNVNCITGSFTYQLSPSLLEELVRDPQGGAIAAIGPSGVTDLIHATAEVDAFYGATTGPAGRGRRIGEVAGAVIDALSGSAQSGDATPLLSKVLMGDPTARLVLPYGPAGVDLAAVGGDGLVDLSWTPVAGAASYSLWRSDTGAGGPWTLLAEGVAGTTFRDTGDPPGTLGAVVNGAQYWYELEPMDAAGHCGRWSPVATARPCTFDVPAPATALAVSAGNCTGSFTVMFTRSPTPNLQGHIVRVYRGLQAAGVPERQLLITGAFASINGLVRFRDYTFTVTPLTWCNVEGPPTAPVTRSSDCALALDPPAFILDLHAARAGSAIRLDWGAITRTVTGTAANIVGYVVYRAAVPGFVADPSTEIARPAGLTLVDPARVGNGIAVEFYAVAAVDSAGRRGGVGHDFPQGVTAFKNDLGSDWEITWTPVPYDIQGDETPVAAYEVYTATGPLTRARIEAEGLLPRVVVAAGPVTVPEIPGEDAVFVVPRDVHGNRSVN